MAEVRRAVPQLGERGQMNAAYAATADLVLRRSLARHPELGKLGVGASVLPRGRILTELGRMLVAGWKPGRVAHLAVQIARDFERGNVAAYADMLRRMRRERED
jgi:hypothetical protein